MKKVIYIPRKKDITKNFNVEVDTVGGSYIDFPMYDTVDMVIGSSERNFISQARFNYVSTTTDNNIVNVTVCAEVIPDWFGINRIINRWEQNSSRYAVFPPAYGPATPFHFDQPITYKLNEGFERSFIPTQIQAERQTVYAAFYNIPHVNEGEPWRDRYNTNVLFRVNCENASDFGFNFFDGGTIGPRYDSGSRFNSWRNLYNKLETGVMAWTNNQRHLNSFRPYAINGCKLYFPSCITPNSVIMDNFAYYLENCGNNVPEDCGIDSNYFNAVINI